MGGAARIDPLAGDAAARTRGKTMLSLELTTELRRMLPSQAPRAGGPGHVNFRRARFATFNKLPFGPEHLDKTKSSAADMSAASCFLSFVGGVVFLLSFLLFWLIAPLPYQIPLLCQRNARGSRRLVRYLLAAGYVLNFVAVFLALHFKLDPSVTTPYIDGVYQVQNWIRTLSFAGGFSLAMSILCILHVHVPGLCTKLIAPFVTGKLLIERNRKDDLYERAIDLIEKKKPEKLKRQEAANKKRLSMKPDRKGPDGKLLSGSGTDSSVADDGGPAGRADLVDSSIWLFPLVSFLAGFAVYCFVDWFLAAAQPFMQCQRTLNATSAAGVHPASVHPAGIGIATCVAPMFLSLDKGLCCYIVDGKGSIDRLVPQLGGYLGAGYGLMCSVGTTMVWWQLNEVNRQITKLLEQNHGILIESEATASEHSRLAQLADKIQQIEVREKGEAEQMRALERRIVEASSYAELREMFTSAASAPDPEAGRGAGAGAAMSRRSMICSRRESCRQKRDSCDQRAGAQQQVPSVGMTSAIAATSCADIELGSVKEGRRSEEEASMREAAGPV